MKYSIIGAGIGGLTTALAFEKAGIEYQVFEKIQSIATVGAGIWLAPNALQVLEHINVLDEIQQKGNSIDRITLGKADLSTISDNNQNTIKQMFGYSTIAIHRAELHSILYSKIPKEKIHLGKGFNHFEELSNGSIKIFFDDNSEYETDFLIGADGIHSKVRKQLFPESQTRYSGQTCWRGVANIKIDKEFQNRGVELWGNQIRFGLSRIAENKIYWFAVALDAPNQDDKVDLVQQKLFKMFSSFHPIVNKLILSTSPDTIIRNDIIDLEPLSKWYKNNICLIGDAAHGATPNLGQGGAQAIEDAYYLSEIIKRQPKENIFEIFQQKRIKKVNSIVKQSWITGKMAHWKYGRGVRNFILKQMPNKLLEKKMIELYKIEKVQ
ncbi:MAG: FAD-dependent monooxygenase [Bacteroidota bacterium]